MGQLLSGILSVFSGRKEETRVLMVGLDYAGKTTMLYRLKSGAVVTTIATIGIGIPWRDRASPPGLTALSVVQYGPVSFTVWDVGYQSQTLPLYRHYYEMTSAIMFIVDSTDVARIDEARNVMARVCGDNDLRDVAVLVFANKQDKPDALSADAVADRLEVGKLMQPVHVQAASAVTGDGLEEGMAWLAAVLGEKERAKG
ncbi:small GTP-binding protein domain [Allomyces macrogynus ATCC 38327]|uniref:Small GTP-binding protein domain n=1 Tax=Allomyces macrogynus (strain ATCC 38327) TaxID=578462 RepID=A0A0L0SNV5_ALLM3|nr:small GTP-binding protein domain [Allomyces macrogynus ATCC 38327]|eukprot:KNE64177.1 small GTP-binding protein domain [Allomyces macrogynus ATCC 38327]